LAAGDVLTSERTVLEICSMKSYMFAVALALAAPLAMPAAANAAIVLSAGATGEIASPGVQAYVFNAAASVGSIDFNLLGYRSLDGVNCCTDTLTVDLNGNMLLQMSYNLGGGGSNVVYFGSPTITNYVFNGLFAGGSVDVGLAGVNFLSGSNTLTFTYSGGAQGTGDEAWGLGSVVADAAVGGVPEPSSWAMLITGFGLVGFAARRRRVALAA
jgi:hypothetical protein